jgi:hypothetical protein
MKRTQPSQAVVQRFKLLAAGLLLPLSLLTGCSSTNNTGQGIVGGGLLGGALGALVGAAAGRPLAGAAIGAGIGGTMGGVAGASEDRRERRYVQAVAAAEQRAQDELVEVAKMAQAHVSDAVIIQHVRNSGAIFNLTSDQIVWLKQQGVSEGVIQEMEYTGRVAVRPVYPYPGYVVTQPVVVAEPAPPPGPYVGVGVTYARVR